MKPQTNMTPLLGNASSSFLSCSGCESFDFMECSETPLGGRIHMDLVLKASDVVLLEMALCQKERREGVKFLPTCEACPSPYQMFSTCGPW